MSGCSAETYGAQSLLSSGVHFPGDVSSQTDSACLSVRMTVWRSCNQLNPLLASVVTIVNVHNGSLLPECQFVNLPVILAHTRQGGHTLQCHTIPQTS